MNAFRFGLLLAYLMLCAWTFVIVLEGYGGSIALISLILSLLAFIVGITLKREGVVLVAWIGLGVGFTAAHFSLPNITYFSAIASVMLMLVLIDLADFLRLVEGPVGRNVAVTLDQSACSRSLIKKHFLFVVLLAVLSSIISLTVLIISSPIEFASNPVFAVGLLSASALLVIMSALASRQVPTSL